MDIAIMLEGQNGLNWPRWQRIARAVEELGYAGLYRSDHFTNANPPDIDSLELWISLAWLASHTERIQFGPLVTPLSFRHPAHTARMAAGVDDLSGGRLTLGLGAGWQAREHDHYGFDLLEPAERFARFDEGVQIVKRLLESDDPVDFEGSYFRLKEAVLLPRPVRRGGPPILIGGNGKLRSLPVAARYADEWNAVYKTPDGFAELNTRLDELLEAEDRPPGEVRRSMLTGCVFGKDQRQVDEKVAARTGGKRTAAELRQLGPVVGIVPEMVEQLGRLSEAGLQRVMLQWLDLDDIEGLEAMADGILPHFSN
jgi:F420-dependent oxidoreductase-like protein